jgi:hypothetical protein
MNVAYRLTPHTKYVTACTMDELFTWLWLSLKATSIKKNIYARELSYPTITKIYKLEGGGYLTEMFVHEVSLTPHARTSAI